VFHLGNEAQLSESKEENEMQLTVI